MPWQDWVFSLGGFVLLLSLLPTLRGDQKPALTTSAITSVLIALFSVTMASLGLWLSAVANAGISIAWGILAYQRYQITKREKHEGVLAQIEEEVDVTLGLDDEEPVATPETEPRLV